MLRKSGREKNWAGVLTLLMDVYSQKQFSFHKNVLSDSREHFVRFTRTFFRFTKSVFLIGMDNFFRCKKNILLRSQEHFFLVDENIFFLFTRTLSGSQEHSFGSQIIILVHRTVFPDWQEHFFRCKKICLVHEKHFFLFTRTFFWFTSEFCGSKEHSVWFPWTSFSNSQEYFF